MMIYFSEFSNKQKIFEGGNAIEVSRPLQYSELEPTYNYVKKTIFPLIGLEGDTDAQPIGSYLKKQDNQTSGDIDIAVSVERIAGVNGITVDEVLEFMYKTLSKAGYEAVMTKGFNQVSIGVPINGDKKNGIAQIDLMLSANLNWSNFMYHSPNFREAESKYKGMYRNVLLMSIVSESRKVTTETTEKGETAEYKQYVIRLESGIYEVTKSLMGAKGLIKTAKLLKDQDKFITNTPEEVAELAFGPNVKPNDIMTFEDIWQQFTSPKFIHKNKFDAILERFKIYILSSKVPVPAEVERDFPNLF